MTTTAQDKRRTSLVLLGLTIMAAYGGSRQGDEVPDAASAETPEALDSTGRWLGGKFAEGSADFVEAIPDVRNVKIACTTPVRPCRPRRC